jgi:3-oxoacyl-[acyl-carrier protein] reductase
MKLTNKVAIVTGGGRDIGKAVSLKLATEGAKVVLNYFGSEESANQTVNEIKANGGEAIAVKGDMTMSADVAKLVKASKDAFGNEVHILVNVVGGLVARKTLEDMDEAFWDFVINLNVKPVFLLAKNIVSLV